MSELKQNVVYKWYGEMKPYLGTWDAPNFWTL